MISAGNENGISISGVELSAPGDDLADSIRDVFPGLA